MRSFSMRLIPCRLPSRAYLWEKAGGGEGERGRILLLSTSFLRVGNNSRPDLFSAFDLIQITAFSTHIQMYVNDMTLLI